MQISSASSSWPERIKQIVRPRPTQSQDHTKPKQKFFITKKIELVFFASNFNSYYGWHFDSELIFSPDFSLERRITVLGGRRMKTESQGSPTKEGSPIPSSSKANTENESASGANEIQGDSIQKNVTEKKAIHHTSTSKKKCQRQV